MLTKKELDDIWENKPHGYFTKLKKTLASKEKLNKYLVTARLFEQQETEVQVVEEEVHAKNSEAFQIRDAEWRLHQRLRMVQVPGKKYVTRTEKKLLTVAKK